MTIAISPTRLLAIAAILLLAALGIGGALAQRGEERAAADRLSDRLAVGAVSLDPDTAPADGPRFG